MPYTASTALTAKGSKLCIKALPIRLSLILGLKRTSILNTPGDIIHIDFPHPGVLDERNLCSRVLASSIVAGKSIGCVSSREQLVALSSQWEGQWFPHQTSPTSFNYFATSCFNYFATRCVFYSLWFKKMHKANFGWTVITQI